MTNEEFFTLTPRQFYLLLDRHREEYEHMELCFAVPSLNIARHSFSPPKDPVCYADFMPSQWDRKKEVTRKKRLPRKLIAQNIRCFLLGRIEAQEQSKESQTA